MGALKSKCPIYFHEKYYRYRGYQNIVSQSKISVPKLYLVFSIFARDKELLRSEGPAIFGTKF